MPSLSAAIADRERIRLLPFSVDAALQVLVVGSGASLGREVAPRQFAVALGDFATGWLKRLSARDREILLACAAGAGLGAVYAVPLGGALFAVRIMLKTWHPRALGAALITSSLAVAVASFATHDQPNLNWPSLHVSYRLIGYALVLAPLTLGLGTCLQPPHGIGTSGSADSIVAADPGDRRSGVADRCLLTLVARTARQRQIDPDRNPRRRDDPGNGGDSSGSETPSDGSVLARRREGRDAHPRAGHRRRGRHAVGADRQRAGRNSISRSGSRQWPARQACWPSLNARHFGPRSSCGNSLGLRCGCCWFSWSPP